MIALAALWLDRQPPILEETCDAQLFRQRARLLGSRRVRIRPAIPADVRDLLTLIRELAEYERSPDAVEAQTHDLAAALFGPDPKVWALVAEERDEIVGMAIYFLSFSTWTGRHGVYLEDLYVRPAQRGRGTGRALLSELAKVAVDNGYRRLEWSVLDWNESAIGFYESLGAEAMDEWTSYRLSGEALASLALTAEPSRHTGDLWTT